MTVCVSDPFEPRVDVADPSVMSGMMIWFRNSFTTIMIVNNLEDLPFCKSFCNSIELRLGFQHQMTHPYEFLVSYSLEVAKKYNSS